MEGFGREGMDGMKYPEAMRAVLVRGSQSRQQRRHWVLRTRPGAKVSLPKWFACLLHGPVFSTRKGAVKRFSWRGRQVAVVLNNRQRGETSLINQSIFED